MNIIHTHWQHNTQQLSQTDYFNINFVLKDLQRILYIIQHIILGKNEYYTYTLVT